MLLDRAEKVVRTAVVVCLGSDTCAVLATIVDRMVVLHLLFYSRKPQCFAVVKDGGKI